MICRLCEALIAFMGGTVAGAMAAGHVMVRWERYKWVCLAGLSLAAVTVGALAIWPTSFSVVGVEVIFAIIGLGIGTIFPVTTTAVQNAVPAHQMGTVTWVLNFFRSLGGAILVAAFGAVFLGSVAAGGDQMSIQAIVLEGALTGTDFAQIFRGVFAAASLMILLALAFLMAMEELQLRTHNLPMADEAV